MLCVHCIRQSPCLPSLNTLVDPAGQLGSAAGGTGQQLTLNWMVYVPPLSQRPLRVVLPSGAAEHLQNRVAHRCCLPSMLRVACCVLHVVCASL